MKDWISGYGVPMDANFNTHRASCELCKAAEDNLASLCLEGSILWKRENAVQPKKEPTRRSEFWCSKAQMKSLMRHK